MQLNSYNLILAVSAAGGKISNTFIVISGHIFSDQIEFHG